MTKNLMTAFPGAEFPSCGLRSGYSVTASSYHYGLWTRFYNAGSRGVGWQNSTRSLRSGARSCQVFRFSWLRRSRVVNTRAWLHTSRIQTSRPVS